MKTNTFIFTAVLCLNYFYQPVMAQTNTINDDTTKIKFGKITIIIEDDSEGDDDFDFENEKIENEKNAKEEGIYVNTMMNIGMNGWLTSENQTAFPSQYANMGINYSRSRLFGWDFMLGGLDIFNKHVYISPGMGISWNNYHFNEKITMTTGADTTMFLTDSIFNFSKYKFRNTYLSVPIVIGARIGNPDKKQFDIHAGVIGSFNLNNIVKQKYTVDGTNNKDKIVDDFNVNPFKLEAIARISFHTFGLYAKYAFTEQFYSGKAQSVYPFSIGITFGGI
jgi:hypothetical protein